ncbi:MAG: aliphatic sulfonate ABC transporter substrate-binding protein [Synergistaceae bacterium]|jgi:aliphatic sulfonates family ABC transporter substrate-binding protein|nr:aliphatic sulfonate ABC transporter substrate-binding protein [Synergistaceae bacterium]
MNQLSIKKLAGAVFFLMILALNIFLLVNCAPASGATGEKAKLILASQPSVFQPVIAREKGFFTEEGLDVEINQFSYGPPIVEAITAKNADFGFLGDMPAYSAIANNAGVIVIGSIGVSSVMHGIAVRSDRNIDSLEDLKGKAIGVPFGSNAQPLVYLYLDKANLTENDVEIFNVAAADITAALVRGDIDAGVVWEPVLSVAIKEGNNVKLLATAEGIKLFADPIIARKEFIEAHPEETTKLLRALDRAGAWAHEHQQEAAELQNKATEVDMEALLLTLAKKDLSAGINDEWLSSFEKGAHDAFKYGLLKKEINVRNYVNLEFLKAAGIQ